MSNYVGVLGNQVFFGGGQWKQRYKCKNNGINLNTLNPEWKYTTNSQYSFILKRSISLLCLLKKTRNKDNTVDYPDLLSGL